MENQKSNEEQEQEHKSILDGLPPELQRLLTRPTIYVFITPEGDTEFGTNVPALGAQQALGYMQMAQVKMSLDLIATAEMDRQRKLQEVTSPLTLPAKNLYVPR